VRAGLRQQFALRLGRDALAPVVMLLAVAMVTTAWTMTSEPLVSVRSQTKLSINSDRVEGEDAFSGAVAE